VVRRLCRLLAHRLLQPLPPEVQATIGVVFWIGLLTAALIGFKVWHSPTDDEARDLIDGSIEGRPLRAWADRRRKRRQRLDALAGTPQSHGGARPQAGQDRRPPAVETG